MHTRTTRAIWVASLTALVLVPVALAAWRTGSKVMGTLSVGLGLLALCALVVVVVVPSRVRSLTASFGVEKVLGLHRWLGILAVVLVVMHLTVALTEHPAMLDPFASSSATRAGYVAVVALLLTGFTAARGRRPGARYEIWARLHVALAAAALVLAGLHVIWLGNLIADPVMRVVLSVLAAVLLAVLAHRWVWRPLFSRQGAYVVYGVRRESPTVCTLVLAPVHLRRGGLHFSPGQFVWLRLRRGVVGTEEHPFTIASSAQVTGRIELTVRDTGDFSSLLGTLRRGSKVWLDGPHGSFSADHDQARDSDGLVLIAGGVGITPMMSMLRTLADRGDTRTHRLVLAERGDEPLFSDELDALARRLTLRITRTEGRRIDVDLLGEVIGGAHDTLDYFVCGSPALLAGTLAALEGLGVPEARIHTEQFGWSGAIPVPPEGTGGAPAEPTPDVLRAAGVVRGAGKIPAGAHRARSRAAADSPSGRRLIR